MILLLIAGILLIVYGAGSLVSPRMTRSVDRVITGTHAEGSESRARRGANRVLRSVVMIAVGVAILMVPLLVWQL